VLARYSLNGELNVQASLPALSGLISGVTGQQFNLNIQARFQLSKCRNDPKLLDQLERETQLISGKEKEPWGKLGGN
jgi:hypothetical protein